MKVLVLGKGGREHALVWKLAQSPRVDRVFCAPGNAGTAQEGVNVPVDENDFDDLIRLAKTVKIGLTDGNVTEVTSGELTPGTAVIVGEARAEPAATGGGGGGQNPFAPKVGAKKQ